MVMLMLLGSLVWVVVSSLARQDRLADHHDIAELARADLTSAILTIQRMQLSGQRLQLQQSRTEVAATLSVVDEKQQLARELISDLLVHADSEAAPWLTESVAGLDRLREALVSAASKREAMIAVRDDTFGGAQAKFTDRRLQLERGLELTEVPTDERSILARAAHKATEAARSLRLYEGAMQELQADILRFLVTGDPLMPNELQRATTTASTLLSNLSSILPGESLRPELEALADAGGDLVRATNALFEAAAAAELEITSQVDPASYRLVSAMQQSIRLFTSRAEQAGTEARHDRLHGRRQTYILGAVLVALFVLSSLLTVRAVASPLKAMTLAVRSMADGDTDVIIKFATRRDEIGKMAEALTRLREVVRHAFLQGQIIDQIPIGVMTVGADPALPVIYVNPHAAMLLSPAREHPGLPHDCLHNIAERLFYNPTATLSALRDPARLPYSVRVSLEGETLEVTATSLSDRLGAFVGSMLIWQRLTKQVQLAAQFEASVGGITATLGGSAEAMKQTAFAMDATAASNGESADAAARAVKAASLNVRAVATATEQLSASVQATSDRVKEAAASASQAVQEAAHTDRCVNDLNAMADRIGGIVSLIAGIAAQTNLLALNATIEAARAGEAGRGFAVVAQEVKALAGQTVKATQEISAQVNSMQLETGSAVTTLRSVGAALDHIDQVTRTIAAAVAEQGMATRKIAQSVQQAAADTAMVTSNISAAADKASQTRVQSREVLTSAEASRGQTAMLKAQVNDFLLALRPA